jgi:hypothetical protein
VPIVTGIASLAGLRFLDRYLARHGLDIGQVAGLSDYLRATLIGAVAILPAAALLLVSIWGAGYLRGRARLVTALMLLAPLLWIPVGAAGAEARFKLHPSSWDYILQNLYGVLPMVADRPLALIIFCALPAAGAGLLLRTALDSRPEQPRWWWWIFIAVMSATLYQAGEPLAAIYDRNHIRANQGVVDGLPIYRFRLTASAATQDGAPAACRCGADILWNGERGVALQCAGGQALAVLGPQNWALERQALWSAAEQQTFDVGASPLSPDPAAMRMARDRAPSREAFLAYQDAQFTCRVRENLSNFVGRMVTDTPKSVQVAPTLGGWRAFVPSSSGDGALGMRCFGGSLFVDLSHTEAPNEATFDRQKKSVDFFNARLGATPTMRAGAGGAELLMDGDLALVENMSAFSLDPLVDTMSIDGVAYSLEAVRELEQRTGTHCLYAEGGAAATYSTEMRGGFMPVRPPIAAH